MAMNSPHRQPGGPVAGLRPVMDPSATPDPLRPSPGITSRAAQYEDEKQRITRSCFSKLDDVKGTPLQTYITHCRVEEDAMYPSSPPPPHANAQYKKARVVIIAVKSSGRVQIHKARENEGGDFQIGKSWNMDELSAVEVFSNPQLARTPEERERAEWGGPFGFVITISKPYYWLANTPKEKIFFISSLIKVYRKFTSGKVPQLVGFDSKEEEEILQTSAPPPPKTSTVSAHPTQLLVSGSQPIAQPQPPVVSQQQPPRPRYPGASSPDNSLSAPVVRQGPPSPLRPRNGPSNNERNVVANNVPQLRSRSSQEAALRQATSREQIRVPRPQLSPPMLPAPQRLTPESSHSNMSSQSTYAGGDLESHDSSSRYDQDLPTKRHMPNSSSGTYSNHSTDRWKPEYPPTNPPARYGTPPESVRSDAGSHHTVDSNASVNTNQRALPERRRPPLQESAYAHAPRSLTEDGESNPRRLGPRSKPDVPTSAQIEPTSTNFSSPSHSINRASSNQTPPPPTSHFGTSKQIAEHPLSHTQSPPQPLAPARLETTDLSNASHRSRTVSAASETIPAVNITSPVSPETPETPAADSPVYRAGLGPMMGKKDSAGAANLRKAINAAKVISSFKPRAGGAGDRILARKDKSSNEPDGINEVVPAPRLQRPGTNDSLQTTPIDKIGQEKSQQSDSSVDRPLAGIGASRDTNIPPKPETASQDLMRSSPALVIPESTQNVPKEEKPVQTVDRVLRQAKTNPYAKSLSALDINPNVLRGRHNEFDTVLREFGWSHNIYKDKDLQDLEADIRREVGKLEAGSWLGASDEHGSGLDHFEKMLDKAIFECDQMEGLLTLYGVELSTLNEDISYIEAQSAGLQVQTANQKLLHSELQNLVETVSIGPAQLEPLRKSSLNDPDSLESIESCLMLLHKALSTIDPQLLKQSSTIPLHGSLGGDLANMRALQEKKGLYMNEALHFLDRTKQYMDPAFASAFAQVKNATARRSNSIKGMAKLDPNAHELARASLWQYSPIMLFAKEINTSAWESVLHTYLERARPMYTEECHESIAVWQKTARKPTNEETDALFTAQEEKNDGLSGTARKLTVKRSQTLSRTLRSGSNAADKKMAVIQNPDAKLYPFEAFAGALDDISPLIIQEQNFVVDFFHANSMDDSDFTDTVLAAPPEERRGTNLLSRRPPESDRFTAKRVYDCMEGIFSVWPRELQSLVEWSLQFNELQGVGILCALERKRLEFDDTNQEFMTRTLLKIHERLAGLFNRCVDEQIRAIEDTKVKIKKRKGVITFMKVFPNFAAVVENMLPRADGVERLEIRGMVDSAYSRINKVMFDSLKIIAKESPVVVTNGPSSNYGADPDDKEALNYHILLIENMHHYASEVEERGDSVLGEWRGKALMEKAEHQEHYVAAVIRRPLGKLLDFVEGCETILAQGRELATNIPNSHPSHSRSAFKKVMGSHTTKDIKKGVDALRGRVDKHFGDTEEPTLSQKLVTVILGECENKYVDILERTQRIASEIFEGSVEVEFGRQDISQAFRR